MANAVASYATYRWFESNYYHQRNNMKQALILGCSHAAGSEMGTDEYGRAHSYPVQLADLMGYQATNRAIPGGSNDAMFRIFQEQINNYDIVIVCWTGIARTELWDTQSQTWLPMAHGVVLGNHNRSDLHEYGRQWTVYQHTQQAGHLTKTKNILALNFLAHSKNIPVINIDSFQPVDWPERMTWPASMLWPVLTTFCGWALQHHYSHTDNGHFDLDAHTAFANYVFKNMAG